MSGVTYHDSQRSGEQPVVGINPDRTQRDTILFGMIEVIFVTIPISSCPTTRSVIGYCVPTDLPPTCFHNPVAETLAHLRSIRTVCPVNLDTSAHCHESEHIISVNRITTFCQFKFQSFQVLVDHKHILFGC